MEDPWRDAVSIYIWDQELLQRGGVQPVCGSRHVEQLVLHWMTVGSLVYPFAQHSAPRTSRRVHSFPQRQNLPKLTSDPKRLGEIAIDRVAIQRILINDPQALKPLLQTLLLALEDKNTEFSAFKSGRGTADGRRVIPGSARIA